MRMSKQSAVSDSCHFIMLGGGSGGCHECMSLIYPIVQVDHFDILTAAPSTMAVEQYIGICLEHWCVSMSPAFDVPGIARAQVGTGQLNSHICHQEGPPLRLWLILHT